MKKIITTCFILIGLTTQAQDNQIKLNLFALALGNISLQYEHTLKEHSSICLGVSILPSRYLPTVITDKDSSGALKLLSFSGFSFTPEYRYYFSGNAPTRILLVLQCPHPFHQGNLQSVWFLNKCLELFRE